MRARVLRARRTRASLLFINLSLQFFRPGRLLLLGFLDHHPLVGVAHALALVRLRRTVSAYFRGDLSDLLLVDTPDDDLGLYRNLRLDALGHLVNDRMRIAERQVELVAGDLRPVADADQRQSLLVAVGDAFDHVRDQ